MREHIMLVRSGDDILLVVRVALGWRLVMRTLLCASALFLGVLAGPANAKSIWDQISESAPRSSVFEDLNLTAPKSLFETLNESAPRSDGVYGELEKNAP
jgi:hypothetical protein